jgi:hypothetical protein
MDMPAHIAVQPTLIERQEIGQGFRRRLQTFKKSFARRLLN